MKHKSNQGKSRGNGGRSRAPSTAAVAEAEDVGDEAIEPLISSSEQTLFAVAHAGQQGFTAACHIIVCIKRVQCECRLLPVS